MQKILQIKKQTIEYLNLNNVEEYLENKSIKNKKLYLNRIFNFIFYLKYYNKEINEDTFIFYQEYLKNIPSEFIGIKLSIKNINWRPFNKQINIKTIENHLSILKLFLKEFYNKNYEFNIDKKIIEKPIINKKTFDRFIDFISSNKYYVPEAYEKRRKARLRWILCLIFLTGSKITELLLMNNSDIKKTKDGYIIQINNTQLILSDYFLSELKKYRRSYGIKAIVLNDDNQLIMSLSSNLNIKTNTIQKEFLDLKKQMIEYYDDDLTIKNEILNLSLIDFKKFSILEHLKINSHSTMLEEFGFNKNTLNRYIKVFNTI